MAYIGRGVDKISNIEVLDVITFTNSAGPYNLLKDTVAFTPTSPNALVISIDGVIQSPDSYTIASATITFDTSMSSASTNDFIYQMGVGILTAPSDGSVTAARLATDAVETAKIKDLNVTAGKLATTQDLSTKTITLPATVAGLGTGIDVTSQITGVVPTANLGSGSASSSTYLAGDQTYKALSEYDDNQVQSNIAMLGFKVATNGSLVKYSLVDQTIDEFNDTSGVDASASTNETRGGVVGGYYYHGATGSYPTGGASIDTSVSGYRTHVFTSDAGFVVPSSGTVDVLVVAGGGSGGSDYGGGGGAGGLVYKTSYAVTANTYDAVIGAGGTASGASGGGNIGGDSTWTINGGSQVFIAKGGGGGGSEALSTHCDTGGSGGGASYLNTTGCAATQGSQAGDSGTYGFGYAGGNSTAATHYNPGGGGGAGSTGENGSDAKSGDGGTGKDYSAVFGTVVGDSGWFASGGGAAWTTDGNSQHGTASSGGGGAGGIAADAVGTSGDVNTGGGGGGNAQHQTTGSIGGTGVVLVRYADSEFSVGGGDLTLQSTDSTALSAPTYGEFVTLIENNEGTATLNTDIKGYISRDSGTTFTQGTLVDEGTWGTNKKILGFHDLDISAQPSGTSMCYKITTHNQSAGSKETRVYATSIGWR